MKQKKTKAPIKNEATNGLKNKRGTLAMARTNDPNSATVAVLHQPVDNDFLDNKAGDSATRSSAGSIRAWTWWTRSRP